MNCNNTPKCKEPCGDCTQEWPRPAAAQAPAEAHGNVLVPLAVLEDASSAIGNFVSDYGWGDSDMQAMDNLDAYIARHKANVAANVQPKGTAAFNGWYCAHCQRGVDSSEVTYHEQHTVCGRVITDDVPPAQAPAPAHAPGHVAWVVRKPGGYCEVGYEARVLNKLEHGTPLYTAPKSGSFMTREQAIAHCRNRRPGIQPTEQHIAATIDAYSALFGDLAPAESASPAVAHQKPLTDAQIEELKDDGTFYESCRGIVREIERLHGIGPKD